MRQNKILFRGAVVATLLSGVLLSQVSSAGAVVSPATNAATVVTFKNPISYSSNRNALSSGFVVRGSFLDYQYDGALALGAIAVNRDGDIPSRIETASDFRVPSNVSFKINQVFALGILNDEDSTIIFFPRSVPANLVGPVTVNFFEDKNGVPGRMAFSRTVAKPREVPVESIGGYPALGLQLDFTTVSLRPGTWWIGIQTQHIPSGPTWQWLLHERVGATGMALRLPEVFNSPMPCGSQWCNGDSLVSNSDFSFVLAGTSMPSSSP